MASVQQDLFGPPELQPPGFRYEHEVISEEEERELLGAFAALAFKPFEFHGFTGRRQIISFGYRYDFSGQSLRQADEFPDYLKRLRVRAARFAGISPEAFVHAMVTEYPAGAPIGWHRDRPEFERIVGISLLSEATFRFRRRTTSGIERITHIVEPRSAYLIDGEARSAWEHSIPPAKERRFSVTFRTLR
jgi:alkylated DNA repair dioxygenase AlkB